ncbi:hypothetical protein GXW82_01945 [Streptacidiphilus sp. 4-A2]|nr:hypothetical protein [Streptacidiphilus sp. 4-A2]
MNTTDYIVNGILVLLVVRQIRGRPAGPDQPAAARGTGQRDRRVLPAVRAHRRERPGPGTRPGRHRRPARIGCGLATLLTRRPNGVHARAGVVAAALWILGMATRMGFASPPTTAPETASPTSAHPQITGRRPGWPRSC